MAKAKSNNSEKQTTRSENSTPEILLPDGSKFENDDNNRRTKTRKSEDEQFVPVIIKRNDITRRHPDDALSNAIEEGLEQLNRPVASLLLSAVAAGLIVGFSAMAVAVVLTATAQSGMDGVVPRILTAFVYPLGFVVCVLSGAQLFTEHTATALYPVLDGKSNIFKLIRLWILVIVGNLLGAILCAAMHYMACEVVHAKSGYIQIGHHLTQYSNQALLVSAVMAGWLMALGAWLLCTSSQILSQVVVIYIATFLIGIGGLHHSIAGSVEMFSAMFLSSEFSIQDAIRFIALALTGNLIGGSCFVALLNYGHIRKTND